MSTPAPPTASAPDQSARHGVALRLLAALVALGAGATTLIIAILLVRSVFG